ncbi:MAG: YdcF family protein [Chitinophagales bacterium]|nr:YdcF family protein [Chitinophagales bacterium]
MKYIVSILLLSFILYCSGCISVVGGPKRAFENAKEHNVVFDAIIVPGIPLQNGHWDSVMKARVIWAYVLYKNGMTKNIIFSGNAVYQPYYESKVMGLYAQALGIPKENIFYDTMARHSTENAYYSYLVAKKHHFKVLALASDPFQSALLRKFTKVRFGTQIYHMPFVMDSVKKYSNFNPEINPELARSKNFNASLTDEQSSFRRFFGTMGGDINWKQYEHRRVPPL